VKKTGNVIMPISFELSGSDAHSKKPLPNFIKALSIANISSSIENSALLNASEMRYPFTELAQAAAAMGHLNVYKEDGIVRSEPLLIMYGKQAYPSMSLALAVKAQQLKMKDVIVNSDKEIQFGNINIHTNNGMLFHPAFYPSHSGRPAFKQYSFYDVYSNKISASIFKDKIVLIGATASGMGERFVTPINDGMTGVVLQANTLSSLLNEKYFIHSNTSFWVEVSCWIIVGLYLIILLPRLGPGTGAALSVVLLIGLLGTEFILLTNYAVWVQNMNVVILLLLGHLVLTTKRYFTSEGERQKIQVDSVEANKMLGLSFQSQNMLDMAFEKFCQCPVNEDILTTLYSLAFDFERQRQFDKAGDVYAYIIAHAPNYKDSQARLERAKNTYKAMKSGIRTSGGTMQSLMTYGSNPTLGRYEILKELGKGAMGIVYHGRDPKINRNVAIKTLALSMEFEADELEEATKRFFREAETAGQLNHPNIVTIYDAGEEHDLAYIAMELLSGTDLSQYTKANRLLPAIATLKIVGKVAQALDYAHKQGVVHRDIKPANIMMQTDKTIKVTDFGIACVTASSKTKTGVILGTPSYMSPEQLAGKHVDGRSDLFSLGVMLYEMLTGTRPFHGDSMATLMFQITNEPHRDIRQHKADLPGPVVTLIDKLLAKDVEARFSSGTEVVQHIISCLRSFPKKQ
ncbi:MAG: serine/threonine-protein kinase, partial [Mariprofundaceae bacterium]|nr:serine/threonine-protein kinase [Mariprofundaceae bacterium]